MQLSGMNRLAKFVDGDFENEFLNSRKGETVNEQVANVK